MDLISTNDKEELKKLEEIFKNSEWLGGGGGEYKGAVYIPIEPPKEPDNVNSPSHYTQGSIECIDAMQSAFGAEELAIYCKIAAFKYLWRSEHKGGIEDIRKADWYLKKMIDLRNNDEG